MGGKYMVVSGVTAEMNLNLSLFTVNPGAVSLLFIQSMGVAKEMHVPHIVLLLDFSSGLEEHPAL